MTHKFIPQRDGCVLVCTGHIRPARAVRGPPPTHGVARQPRPRLIATPALLTASTTSAGTVSVTFVALIAATTCPDISITGAATLEIPLSNRPMLWTWLTPWSANRVSSNRRREPGSEALLLDGGQKDHPHRPPQSACHSGESSVPISPVSSLLQSGSTCAPSYARSILKTSFVLGAVIKLSGSYRPPYGDFETGQTVCYINRTYPVLATGQQDALANYEGLAHTQTGIV